VNPRGTQVNNRKKRQLSAKVGGRQSRKTKRGSIHQKNPTENQTGKGGCSRGWTDSRSKDDRKIGAEKKEDDGGVIYRQFVEKMRTRSKRFSQKGIGGHENGKEKNTIRASPEEFRVKGGEKKAREGGCGV